MPEHHSRSTRGSTIARAIALVSTTMALGCAPGGGGVTAGAIPIADAATMPGAAPRDLTEEEQVRHALNRLAFGPRPGDVARVRAMGVDRWIAAQLDPARVDDSAMERRLLAFPITQRAAGELLRESPPPGAARVAQLPAGTPAGRARQVQAGAGADASASDTLERRLAIVAAAQRGRQIGGELQAARVARAVASERQLQEVLTDFWLNHFSVFIGKGQLRYHVGDFERLAIRPHVMGRFRDLLGAVAHSPAMLLYLDNAQSVADSGRPTLATARDERRRRIADRALERRQNEMTEAERSQLSTLLARRPRGLNENYARELLELHTLGVDGGYSQQDIVEVARAFTGWTVRPPRSGTPEFLFNRATHDAGAKMILGRRFKGGQGVEDGEQVLDLLADHPATATFIARKLVVRFVSDSPSEALVARAAETFRRTDGSLREVVRSIVTSPEFFSRSAYRAKVKSPFEVVVSAARAVGAAADTTLATAQVVARLGQPIFGRQSPDGWPETGSAWMNAGAILGRINFGLALAGSRIPGARLSGWPAYRTLRSAAREVQVDSVIDAFLGGAASPDTRAVLLSGVNPMLASDSAGAAAADLMADDPPPDPMTDRAPAAGTLGERRAGRRAPARLAAPQLSGLDQVIGLALGSPEFQRR